MVLLFGYFSNYAFKSLVRNCVFCLFFFFPARYCANTFPGPTVTAFGSHELRVFFLSNHEGTGNGFKAIYRIRKAFTEEIATKRWGFFLLFQNYTCLFLLTFLTTVHNLINWCANSKCNFAMFDSSINLN